MRVSHTAPSRVLCLVGICFERTYAASEDTALTVSLDLDLVGHGGDNGEQGHEGEDLAEVHSCGRTRCSDADVLELVLL